MNSHDKIDSSEMKLQHRCVSLDQSGQSLVEFVVIIPLFFIFLSCVNLYLNQKIKSITEHSAYESLLIAESHFDSKEREAAHWNTSTLKMDVYHNEIINQSLNGSKFFKNSVDMKNEVFFDKKNIKTYNGTNCDKNPGYHLNPKREGEFDFSICADGSAFETASFSYQKIVEDFKSAKINYSGKSIYYPSDDFSWAQRSFIVPNAIRKLQTNYHTLKFSLKYASLGFPYDFSEFNSKCLMNPKDPVCKIPTLETKWRRTAFHSANKQILECLLEASAKCLSLVTPPLIAECILEKTAEISFALTSGTKADGCPMLNHILEIKHNSIITALDLHSAKNILQETYLRNE